MELKLFSQVVLADRTTTIQRHTAEVRQQTDAKYITAASVTNHNSSHAGAVLGELVENYSFVFEQNAADRPVESFYQESFQDLARTKLYGLLS